MNVLIAEDDPVSRQLLEAVLRKWGYEPLVARDGLEAWCLLEADDAPPMVILDWMMPGLEGPEIVRRLREREALSGEGESRYVILLTAKETKADIIAGFSAGADDYVTKPFNRDELRARVTVGARMLELRAKLARRVRDLEIALERVETLQGLLPICSYCKKIRDDQDYWTDVESYIERFSAAEFSHGVCPDCYATHLKPRLDEMRRAGKGNAGKAAPKAAPSPAAPKPEPAKPSPAPSPAAPSPAAPKATSPRPAPPAGTRPAG